MDTNTKGGVVKTPPLKNLITTYKAIKPQIEERIETFLKIKNLNDDYAFFKEFVFCLLTPQSKAKASWNAVLELDREGLLKEPSYELIREKIKGVRFRNTKAKNIIFAFKNFYKNGKFTLIDKIRKMEQESAREFLSKNVRGMGYKEASHFLRNIGFGFHLAILDRHILKNLKKYGIIEELPKTLTKKLYLQVENKMREFSRGIRIPLHHLDLLLWYNETGEIFK